MDAEKQTSKGGFLNLFDWNAKSRKKLFSNKSELPEISEKGKENVVKSKIMHPQLMEVHGNGPGPRGKRISAHSFPSLVASDVGYETRAPGVVARLMGLDSLPTSTASVPCFTPYCDASVSIDSYSQRSQRCTSNFRIEHHIVNNMPNERVPGNLVDSRLQKVHNRPIERFQTEMLPPKSAKPIPITHHRLLSPIKNPGFVQTNDIAYIMEAASKIIEQGPPTTTNSKTPHFVSSSVPLRIRDLKGRMEAVQRASDPTEAFQRPKEPVVCKYKRGHIREKNHSGLVDTQMYNASVRSGKSSLDRLNNKGKSVSLAVQAKVNVQRGDRLTSNNSRRSINRKETDEVKMGRHNMGQSDMQSVPKRTFMGRNSGALKQNNQKQNCAIKKDKVPFKASVPNQQILKAPSIGGSVKPSKTSSKVLNSATDSRKTKDMVKNTGKDILSSKTKSSSEREHPVRGNKYLEDRVANNITITKDDRLVKCNITSEGCLNWDVADRKNTMDVVSFTFTSPIKKSPTVSESSGQVMENGVSCCHESRDENDCGLTKPTLSYLGSNEAGGDALSVLLEQKLKELTCRVELSDCNLDKARNVASTACTSQDTSSTFGIMSTTQNELCIGFEHNLHKDRLSLPYDVDCISVHGLLPKANENWQGLEEMEGQSIDSCNRGYRKERDCLYVNLTSTLEHSSSEGSYNSSDLNSISITDGCKRWHMPDPHEMIDCLSTRESQSVEVDSEFADSASSSSAAYMSGNSNSPAISLIEFKRSGKWELEYITKILCNSDLALEDLVLGQVNKAIMPYLFDHLENSRTVYAGNAEEYFKLERKVFFDGVIEYLEQNSEQLFGGNFKAWSKWVALFRGKGCLAEKLYKEISCWTSMGDLMVDELVDRDMSSGKGRWVDFEVEAFEEGVEIEMGILTSLVDELIADFLLI